ncbi:MFS transporter [Actinomadura keratinilytica]|uniref:MFS transporter n=1 Tax=Actinomadura keratinilytica TaxID=547461 RepID=A0ABP7Z423_9ACTN
MSDTDAAPAYRWRWAALMVILTGEVMDMLDTLVTAIAAPTIRADLGGSAGTVQWLTAGYTLAMAVGLITGGRLGDLYGRRRMFLVGAAGFTAASLLCGLAQSPGMLVGARVAQGLFGALMLPQGLGMIKQMFPPQQVGTAFAAFGPVMGASSVGGPVLAGWLTGADLFGTGWRMIFLINLPLGLAAVLAGLRFLPRDGGGGTARLDLPGAALAALGAGLLVYPLVQGRELDWPAWIFALLALSVAVFGVFSWYETRVQRAGGDPLVVPGLFRKRGFTAGLLVGMVFFGAMTGLALVFTLYLQMGLGYSPLKAGLSQVPWSLGILAGFGAAQAVQRFGRAVIHAGIAVMAAGVAGIALILHIAGIGVGPWQLAPALLVCGTGMGLLMAPFFDIVVSGVEPHETGSAGGTLTAVQQFGSALGAAVLGTVFFGLLGGQVAAEAEHAAAALRDRLAAAGVAAPQRDRVVADLRACGRDRASAKDGDQVPASCVRLGRELAAAAAADPAAAPAIRQAVGTAAERSAKEGFGGAMTGTLWVVIGMLGLTFLLAFLLPRHARPDGDAPGAAALAVAATA